MHLFYSDSHIIEDLKSSELKNNNRALTYLYKQYFPMASDVIRKRGGSSFWIEEVFQDAIITLYESVKKDIFNQKSSIKTYLYAIIRNKWLTVAQKNCHTETLTSKHQGYLDNMYYIPDSGEEEARNLLLRRLLENLGDPCKKLLTSYYYDKMSMREISAKMGYSNEKSTKTQKFKCLQRLIDMIENQKNIKYTLSELI